MVMLDTLCYETPFVAGTSYPLPLATSEEAAPTPALDPTACTDKGDAYITFIRLIMSYTSEGMIPESIHLYQGCPLIVGFTPGSLKPFYVRYIIALWIQAAAMTFGW